MHFQSSVVNQDLAAGIMNNTKGTFVWDLEFNKQNT